MRNKRDLFAVLTHLWVLILRVAREPWLLLYRFRKARAILNDRGFRGIIQKVFYRPGQSQDYKAWIEANDTLSDRDYTLILAHIDQFRVKPKISIVMPTFNSNEKWLRSAIESVINQIYDNWELCIADDNSADPSVRGLIREFAERDSRIKYIFQDSSEHIARTSNRAVSLATGDYLGFLDHDDQLNVKALYLVAHEINKFPSVDLIYSDEDKIDESGVRLNPFFKPDWNPELICAQNYICHFTVVSKEIFTRVGGFRDGVNGAQDWDLVLRVSENTKPSNIRHIPHILYHWRMTSNSTALSAGAKPYVPEAQKRVVQEHLNRLGEHNIIVEVLESLSHVRVRRNVPSPAPLVSLIIPTKDRVELLSKCVYGICEKTDYANIELLIVDNASERHETHLFFEQIAKDPRVSIIRDNLPFNYSRLNNTAANQAKGSILGFLNNDLEIIDMNWLSEMVAHAVRPEVGIVGARLLYPDGTLQHAGVVLGIGGVAGHELRGITKYDPGYFNRAMLARNVSAVTGACMLVRKNLFFEVGGFNEDNLAVAFNDVDLCLKVRKKGLLIIYTPDAQLNHHESASRGSENTISKVTRFDHEIKIMRSHWRDELNNDPYYNLNLTLDWEDFSLAADSRAPKPWRQFSVAPT